MSPQVTYCSFIFPLSFEHMPLRLIMLQFYIHSISLCPGIDTSEGKSVVFAAFVFDPIDAGTRQGLLCI